MSEPRERTQEPAAEFRPAPLRDGCQAHEGASADPQIEDYLDHVFVPLVGRVPYATRATLRAELRAHLEALIDASRELGRQPDQAIRDALAQFGDPQALAREWLRGWRQQGPAGPVLSARPAAFVALGCFGLATSVAVALVVALMLLVPGNSSMIAFWGPVVAFVLPALAGMTTGLLSPGRPAMGAFYALAVLIAVSALSASAISGRTDFNEFAGFAMLQGMFWLPIGCGAAALGGRLRVLREQAPKRWVLPA
jgi:hypothetical protein